jgi:hypothetical protein
VSCPTFTAISSQPGASAVACFICFNHLTASMPVPNGPSRDRLAGRGGQEALGGFYLIEATDPDQALAFAKQCRAPGGGVELRPSWTPPGARRARNTEVPRRRPRSGGAGRGAPSHNWGVRARCDGAPAKPRRSRCLDVVDEPSVQRRQGAPMPHAGSQDGVGLDAVVSRFVVVDEAGSPAWAVGLRTLGRPRTA